MHGALHSRDDIQRPYVLRQVVRRGFPSIEDYVDASKTILKRTRKTNYSAQ